MAASDYLNQVQQLYIAYFGRPADPGGLTYWANIIDAAGGKLSGVITGFAASPESQALYGSMTSAQQVATIYQNLFNRAPEPAGLAFWTGLLNAGTFSASQIAFTILQSAGPGDVTSVANKVAAASAFTADLDTAAEIAGYNGDAAAALARTFLAKVDSTPASIATLAIDAAAAAAQASGTSTTAPLGGGGSAPFSVTKDGSNVVTFAHSGTAIAVAQTGGNYSFTSNAATATITGTVSGITIPANVTLGMAAALASGISFPGTGTLALTDSTATAATLKALEAATSGLLDASTVTSITAASVADAKLLLVTNNGGTGDKIKTAANVAVTLADATGVAATDLSAIEAATTGLVDFSSASNSITGTLAEVNALLGHQGSTGDKIKLSGAIGITLGDATLAASDLNTLDGRTTGLIALPAGSATLTGTLADVNTLYAANATTGNGVNIPSGVNIVLSDSSFTASDLNTLDGRTTGLVSFSAAGITITGTLADVNTLYGHNATTGNGVNIPASANITLSDSSLAASALNTLDGQATGLIAFSAGSVTLTGTLADVSTLYGHNVTTGNGVNIPVAANITLSDTTLAASDLNTLDGRTTGTVDFSGAGNTVTGTLADVNTLLSHKVSTGADGVNLAASVNITLSDTSLTASALNALQGQTTGLVDISGATTTFTGTAADMATLYTHQASTAPGVKIAGNVALALDAGTANATDLNTLDSKTSGTVDFSGAANTIVGLLADVNTVLGAQVASGGNGIKTAGSVNIALRDTSLAASALNTLVTQTTGLIDTTGNASSISGAATDLVTLYTHQATGASGVKMGVNIPLTVTGTTAAAADLNTLDTKTGGTVDFSTSGNTVTGTLADVNTLLSHKVASGNDGVALAGNLNITLSDTSLTATALNTLQGQITGLVDISAATSLTGTATAMATLFTHQASTAPGVKIAATVGLTLDAGTAAAADLNTLDTKTTGTVDFSASGNTVTGTLADVNTLLGHKVAAGSNGVNLAAVLNVSLSDTSLAASALSTLDGLTDGLISFSATGFTLTGTLADINTLYTHSASTGNGVNIPAGVNITLSDTTLAASALNTLDGLTTGLIGFFAGSLALTGTLADVNTLYTHNASSGNGVNIPAAANITLSDTSAAASALNTLDGQTTGTVDFSASGNTVTGTLADVTTLFNHKVTAGNNGVSLAANVNITLTDTSLTASALNTLASQTTGLIDISASATSLTGSAADMLTLFNTHQASTAPGVKIAGNVTLTLDAGTVAAADLNTLDSKTTGTVVFSTSGNTVTGTLADVNTLLSHRADTGNNGVNLGGSVLNSVNPVLNVTLSDSAFVPSDLSTLDGKTSGLISLSASNATITGLYTDISFLYSANVTSGSGNGIALGAVNLVITSTAAQTTNGTMTAAGLRTRDDLTTGLISFTNTGLTVAGFLDDFNALYADNRTTGNGINLPGNLNLVISVFGAATTMAASDMVTLDGYTTGLVDATAITAITSATVAQAKQLLVDGVTNSQVSHKADVAVTITDTGSATAADLKAIEASTTGLVTATGITAITAASAADAKLLLVTNSGTTGDKISLGTAVAVTLSDTTLADASVLVAVDNATTALVDASTVTSITRASLADATQLLVTDNGSSGNKVTWSGSEAVTLTGDTTATAAQLVAIDNATSGLVTATGITSITSASVADAFQLLSTDLGTSGNKINLAANVAVTLAAGTATGTQLIGIETHTTGWVDATGITSITGSAADLKQLLVTDKGSSGDTIGISASVATTVTGTSALATDLIALSGATSTQVNANAVTNITGSKADIQTVLTAIQAGTSITDTALASITLTEAATSSYVSGLRFTGNMKIVLADVANNLVNLGNNNVVAAGKTLTIDGSATTAGHGISVGGGGVELDSPLVLIGGAGNDGFTGGGAADTFTGGAGDDTIGFLDGGLSSVAAMDTITDYRALGNDSISIHAGAFSSGVVQSNVATVVAYSGATLADALNAAALANTRSSGVQIFTWNNDTYVYAELTGNGSTADTTNDFVIKLTGTPFAAGTGTTGLGLGF